MLGHACGACSASSGEAIRVGIAHRLWCNESRMGFDPRDGQVMMPADCSEQAPDTLNEGLVAAGFDGVVSEEADAVLTVGEAIDALPGHSGKRSGSATNPLEGVVNRADLPSIVRGKGGTDPVGVRAVRDDWAPKGDGGVLRSADKDPHPAEAGSKKAEPSVYRTMSG